MGLRKGSFAAGFITCALLFVGCAATFPYQYYGLSADSYKGRLLGPDPKDDVDLALCEPKASDPRPCSVMFTERFLALKQEYKDLQNRLKNCEKPK